MKIPSQHLDIFVSWSKYLLTFWEHLIVESFFQRVKIYGEHCWNCLAFQNGRQTSNERKSAVHLQIWSFTYIAGYLSCRMTDIEGFVTIYGHSDNLLNNKCFYNDATLSVFFPLNTIPWCAKYKLSSWTFNDSIWLELPYISDPNQYRCNLFPAAAFAREGGEGGGTPVWNWRGCSSWSRLGV